MLDRGILPLRWLSEGGDLSARKSDDKSAITERILDKENVQLKYFSDEPHVGNSNFFPPRPLHLYSPLSSSLLPISSLLLPSRCISYSIDCWKLILFPSKSINAIPISMTNRWFSIITALLCFGRSYDRSCAQSYYLHSDLFRCGCDPYNHHVFNISFTGNGAHACRAA